MGQAALSNRRVDGPVRGTSSECERIVSELSMLRRALDEVEDGVVVSAWSAEIDSPRILHANLAFVSLLNRIGDKMAVRRSAYRPDQLLDDHPFLTSIRDSHRSKETYCSEMIVRTIDGSRINLEFRSVPIKNDSTGTSRRIAVFHDVTKQALLEESIRRNERLAGIGLMGAGIAHEISNPTASALLAAETALEMKDSPDAAEQVAACLRNIVTSMDRCGRIVRSLLRYSRQEPTEKQACNINDVVTQVIELARPYKTTHGTELRADLDVEVPLVPMNPLEIELVLLNLIRNAAEAGEDNAVVSIQTSTIDGGVRVSVSDNGPGMNEEQLARVFDPLYTTRHQSGGSGVGMSIAKGIVQGHEGRMEVRSRPGKGTTVFVDLPITAGALSG